MEQQTLFGAREDTAPLAARLRPRTLDEIEQEIIELVFREENMNQTKTAQRLGISRTSLWKKLNRNKQKS